MSAGNMADSARGRPAVLRALNAIVQADDCRRAWSLFARQALDVCCRDARQTRDMLRRVRLDMFAQASNPWVCSAT